jgi:hypothetical protein
MGRPLLCAANDEKLHNTGELTVVMKFLLCVLAAMVLSPQQVYADYLAMNLVLKQDVSPDEFKICHGSGCAKISATGLTEAEWLQASQTCQPEVQDAESERDCIANMIGAFETIVGGKTGTDADRGGTFGNSAFPGQMDCNDEAINTTTYLRLMQQQGLIQHHDILDVKRRGFFLNRWPHTTAVILERASQVMYAVDAWFYDNGVPAVIIPFALWKTGWKPSGSQAR